MVAMAAAMVDTAATADMVDMEAGVDAMPRPMAAATVDTEDTADTEAGDGTADHTTRRPVLTKRDNSVQTQE